MRVAARQTRVRLVRAALKISSRVIDVDGKTILSDFKHNNLSVEFCSLTVKMSVKSGSHLFRSDL